MDRAGQRFGQRLSLQPFAIQDSLRVCGAVGYEERRVKMRNQQRRFQPFIIRVARVAVCRIKPWLAASLTLAILIQTMLVPLALASVPSKRTASHTLKPSPATNPLSRTPRQSAQSVSAQAVTVEAAMVRHAPSLNGRVEGSVRQLQGESVTLNSGAVVTSNLLVPGTPSVQINGTVTFGGTVQGGGSAQPTGYQVTLNGPVTLGHLVTRTDAVAMPTVPAPPPPTGTRDVNINSPGQSIGDPTTLRNLTLNSNVGTVSVPPGTYGAFTVNGGSTLALGVAGSAQPATYNLQSLTVNSLGQVQVVGPVLLTVNVGMNLNGPMGASANPLWLRLNIASGGLTLNSGGSLYGIVQAPASTVSINGNTLLQGAVTSDRLTINSGGVLKGSGGVMDSINLTRHARADADRYAQRHQYALGGGQH
jgi:hypothetical protein